MAPGKMSVVKGAHPRTVMYLPAATEVVFVILMSTSQGITVSRHFEAGEGFLSVKVVTLSTGDTAGEEGISTVRLFVTPALITPETITCRVRSPSVQSAGLSVSSYLAERGHLVPGGGTRGENFWTSCCSVWNILG